MAEVIKRERKCQCGRPASLWLRVQLGCERYHESAAITAVIALCESCWQLELRQRRDSAGRGEWMPGGVQHEVKR